MTENSSTLPKPEPSRGSETPLESWKEIGAYLQKDTTTVRRWEKKEGLPVHRHSHESRSSVYAYPSEIERWRASRRVAAEQAPPAPQWRRFLTPSFVLTIILSLMMVGNGIRPEVVSAQQAGETRTLVCSGPECEGHISPDGKLLAVSLNGGIAIRDLATKTVRTVVPAPPSGTVVLDPIFSPDGSRIAYFRTRAQGTSQEMAASEETAIVNVNGSGSRTVYTSGSPFAWSPDGKRLLLDSEYPPYGMTRFLWLDLASGSIRKLPSEHWNIDAATISPDGRYIAFNASKDRDSLENVYLVASDGSGETQVASSPTYQEPVGWTPDGKNLLFAQYESSVTLWTVPVANGRPQAPPVNTRLELQKGPGSLPVSVSRSGALYYWTRSATMDIYTGSMDPATGKVTSAPVPVPVEGGGHNDGTRWTPDSTELLYFRSGAGAREWHIYSPATGQDRRLAMNDKNYEGYCWSSDGASILFNSSENAQHNEAARFDLAGGRITQLFPRATPFILASCSGNLATGLSSSGIEVRNLVNGSAKQVYPAGPNSGFITPLISHKGQSVAFETPGIIGPANAAPGVLHLVSSEGGPVRDLATAAAPAEFQLAYGATWSPDDRFVYFARRPNSQSPFELFRVPAAGGAAESAGLKVEDMRAINIAPDGTKIAFSVGAITPEIWRVEGYLPGKK